MSIFHDKAIKSVAEAAAKVMAETSHELKGNQHKIDANKNGKVDAHDFKLLRGKKDMKEESELEEASPFMKGVKRFMAGKKNPSDVRDSHLAKSTFSADPKVKERESRRYDKVQSVLSKEEVEQLDEVGDTPAGRKALHKYVDKAISTSMYNPSKVENRVKGMRKATSRLYKDNFYGKKNEEVEMNEEDAYNKDRYAVKNGKATKDNPTHMGSPNYKDQPHHVWATSAEHAMKKSMKKEDVQQLDEAFPTVADAKKRMDAGKTATGSVTKTKTGLVHKRDYKDDDNDSDDMQKKAKGYGARQNYKRSTRVNEAASFTEMLELYNEHGLKVLAPIETEEMDIDGTTIEVIDGDKINGYVETTVEEEVTNDEFTKEYEDQKASFEGKKKQPKVAAGKTTGVKEMPEEYELDESAGKITHYVAKKDLSNHKDYMDREGFDTHTRNLSKTHSLHKTHMGIMATDSPGEHGHHTEAGAQPASEYKKNVKALKKEEYELDERSLTSDEKSDMEKNVKGMKKGLSGFKERYGERAKSVMYGAATNMAKKD
jgi:hypothetical protein